MKQRKSKASRTLSISKRARDRVNRGLFPLLNPKYTPEEKQIYMAAYYKQREKYTAEEFQQRGLQSKMRSINYRVVKYACVHKLPTVEVPDYGDVSIEMRRFALNHLHQYAASQSVEVVREQRKQPLSPESLTQKNVMERERGMRIKRQKVRGEHDSSPVAPKTCPQAMANAPNQPPHKNLSLKPLCTVYESVQNIIDTMWWSSRLVSKRPLPELSESDYHFLGIEPPKRTL